MSLSRVAVIVLSLTMATASAAERVNCPRKVMTAEGTVHTLSGARVFQGPMSKNIEIMPVHGNFDVGAVAGKPGGEPLNLVCVYGGTTETQTLAIPQTNTACVVADAGSGTVAGCH